MSYEYDEYLRSRSTQHSEQLFHRQLVFVNRRFVQRIKLRVSQLHQMRQILAELVVAQGLTTRRVNIYIKTKVLLMNQTRKSS